MHRVVIIGVIIVVLALIAWYFHDNAYFGQYYENMKNRVRGKLHDFRYENLAPGYNRNGLATIASPLAPPLSVLMDIPRGEKLWENNTGGYERMSVAGSAGMHVGTTVLPALPSIMTSQASLQPYPMPIPYEPTPIMDIPPFTVTSGNVHPIGSADPQKVVSKRMLPREVKLYFSDKCHYCKLMMPVWDTVVASISKKQPSVIFIKHNVDKKPVDFIRAVPTIIMRDEYNLTHKYPGGADPAALARWIMAPAFDNNGTMGPSPPVYLM